MPPLFPSQGSARPHCAPGTTAEVHASRTILVTGSTGFVGAELVSRLLSSASAIVAPVRAPSDAAARVRGLAALEHVLARTLSADEARRVHWVAGDLETRRLGWDETTWRGWAERVNEVYHCAAATRFDLPLEQAQRINVGGLLQVHAFSVVAAALGNFRRLHHVSTAYAAGRATHDVRASEALPPDEERCFRNTYERTKARAERFLREYAEVPWTIYRPSIIVGDSRSGRTRSWNVCYAPMRLIAAGRLRMVPASAGAILDYVPVDYVVDGLLALGQRDDTEGQTLHLTAGNQTCAVPECLRLIDEVVASHNGTAPAHTAVIRPWRFEVVARSLQLLRPRTVESLKRFRVYAPYTQVETRFQNGDEAAMLRDAGIAQPAYAEYFPRIVRYAVEHDFGKPSRPARTTGPERSQLGYQLGTLTFVRPSNMARFLPLLPEIDVRLSGRAALMTAASVVGAPLALAESVRFGRTLRRTPVQPPIFIVGHWRSGTTHLHNLLCQDPTFGYLTMYQAMAPDCSLVGDPWLRRLLSRVMPARRPMDDMDWPLDAPQEEEIALGKVLPWSFYNQFLFPRRARQLFDKYVLFRGARPEDVEEWKRQYVRILKVATVHAGGKRLVLKNPVNTARMSLLFDMFPAARFIHIHRDPYDVFSSTRNLHRKVLSFSALQSVSDAELDNTVLHLYEAMMRRYLQEARQIPRHQLIDVRYDELVRRPREVMENVYARLGYDYEQAGPRIGAYLESLRGYQKNSFSPLTLGEAARIEARWGFAFAALGYNTRAGHEQRDAALSA
jgi:omega-hydroxy-beta-dihydromenaquinone-9 sulfotransferase